MILKQGNMWDRLHEVNLFCITTNASHNAKKELVMGRGIAKEATHYLPGIATFAAKRIAQHSVYGLEVIHSHNRDIGFFQVKNKWWEPADLSLICLACEKLFSWIMGYTYIHQAYPKVALNFPGIGNGKLERVDVLPCISLLPDCVEVWEFE